MLLDNLLKQEHQKVVYDERSKWRTNYSKISYY